MSDTEIDIDTSKLTPANQNPWYILMTLYGEQEGDEIDWDLHAKNEIAWNAWAFQTISKDAQEKIAKHHSAYIPKIEEYDELYKEIEKKFYEEAINRGSKIKNIDKLPRFGAIDLSNTLFYKNICLKNFIVCNYIKFDNSSFRNSDFSRCSFLNGFSISNCYFDLFICNFSTFFEDFYSHDTLFSIAKFDVCDFKGGCSFSDSTFKSSSSFFYTTFEGTANFNNICFRCPVDFAKATFLKDSFFIDTKFTSVSFVGCNFHGQANFLRAFFAENFPLLTGAAFLNTVVFNPEFSSWPKSPDYDPKISRESCATIRHALAKQGLLEDAHFFFRREMYSAGEIGSTVQRLPYLIYGWLSDYGYSIQRPAIGLALVWLFGTAILDTAFQFDYPQEAPLPIAAALSFSNLFPFFGFTGTYFEPGFLRELPAPLKVLSAAQTVLSLPLLFFLGLGLRTRFRMR